MCCPRFCTRPPSTAIISRPVPVSAHGSASDRNCALASTICLTIAKRSKVLRAQAGEAGHGQLVAGGKGKAVEHSAKLNTPARHKLPMRGDHLDRRTYNWYPAPALRDRKSRPHIGAMQHLDLTDDEAAALTQELHEIVENDRYPFSLSRSHLRCSPRIRTLRAILAKLRPEPVREQLPRPKVYAPPRFVPGRRRARLDEV
jgi:hypothetical protein